MSKEEKKVKKPKSKKLKVIEWVITGLFAVLFIFVFAGFIDGMVHKKENHGETIRFGWGTFVVQTDSMLPVYPIKSAIITYKDSLENVAKQFAKEQAKEENLRKPIDVSFYDGYKVPVVADDSRLNDQTTLYAPKYKVMTHRIREIHVNKDLAYGKGKYTIIAAGINPGNDQQEGQYQAFTESEYIGVVRMKSNFLGGVFSFISSVWGLLVLLLIPACYLAVVSVLDIFKAFKEDDKVVATQGADGTVSAVSSGSKLDSISASERERLKQELLQEMVEKKKQEKEVKKDA